MSYVRDSVVKLCLTPTHTHSNSATNTMKNVFHFATCIKDEVSKIPQICPSVKVSLPMNHQLSLEQWSKTTNPLENAKADLEKWNLMEGILRTAHSKASWQNGLGEYTD